MDLVVVIVKGVVIVGIIECIIMYCVVCCYYFMVIFQFFKEGYYFEVYCVFFFDGKDCCKFMRQIFVQKGQKVKNGEFVKVLFFRQVVLGVIFMYEDILYVCDDDVCFEYIKDLCKLKFVEDYFGV